MTVTFTDLKAKVKEALNTCKTTIEAELDGYATTEALATKSEVDSKVATAVSDTSVDLSNYYTKSEADAAITTAISAITDGDAAGY